MARNTHTLRRCVALQALVGALKVWPLQFLLPYGVEDAAHFRISHGEFNQRRARNPAEVNIVVEKDGPRVFGRNALALERSFGKDEHLGSGGDIQLLEKGGEVAVFL